MLMISILYLLSSNAVTQTRDKYIFYARLILTILICYLILCLNSFYAEFYATISSSSLSSFFFLLSYVNNLFNLMVFIEFTLVLGLIYLNLNLSLFVPSGCPIGLSSLVVLIEFISCIATYITLVLSLAINILLTTALSLIYTINTYVNFIRLRCSIFYLNPNAANYTYFFILFILYLKQWSPFFLTHEFLSEYMLQMEGPSGAGGGGTSGWGPSGAPGNAPNGNPFNQMFTKNPESKSEDSESINPKATNTVKVQLKIWVNPNTDFPMHEGYWEKQTERLYVKIHPKTPENPGFLSYSLSEQGDKNFMESKYIIARIGLFDVHINSDRAELFKIGELEKIKTIDNPHWIEVRNQNKPAIRIVNELNRFTFMSRNLYTCRIGKGD